MKAADANIIGVFLSAAAQWPDATALIQDGKGISYAALLEDVRLIAASLQTRGLGKGDAVLVAVPMSIELYRCVLALLYIGAVPVFLDAWIGRKRMAECLATVPCAALIARRKLLWIAWLFAALRRIPQRLSTAMLLKADAGMKVPPCAAADDSALITFTTGSTGTPKAARRTHATLGAQLQALMPLLPEGRDISFIMLPIVVLINLAMGKTTVLPPARYQMKKAASIRHLHKALIREAVATMIVSPSVMQHLCNEVPVPGVRQILTGGGPVFPALAEKISFVYPAANATVVYGSTEAEPISHLPAKEIAAASEQVLASLGLPVGTPDATATVRIIGITESPIMVEDEEGWNRLALPAGTTGEIVVSGPHVVRGYVANEAAAARNKIFVGDAVWHRTGDAGRMDADRRLYLLGRCSEIFAWQNEPCYPMIAAYRICNIAGLSDAAITLWQGKPCLIIPKEDLIEDSILQKALADIKLAGANVIRIPRIPKDPRHLTKVNWERLRKMLPR